MCGWFGVSGARPRSRSRNARLRSSSLVLCGAATFGVACHGGSLVVGEEWGASIVDTTELRDAGLATPPDAAFPRDCPPSPIDRQAVQGCWPTDHLGRFHGFFIGTPRYQRFDGSSDEFPTGKVQLSLAADGTGRLSFGAADASVDRGPCGALDTPECESIGGLLAGFAYGLAELALHDPKDDPPRIAGEAPLRRAETLSFAVWLGEPWAAWCAAQVLPKAACPSNECGSAPGPNDPAIPLESASSGSSSCRCGDQGCRPSAPSLRFELRMSQDARALRGVYTPDDRRLSEAHLELEREPEVEP
jgi:hypothetical protein